MCTYTHTHVIYIYIYIYIVRNLPACGPPRLDIRPPMPHLGMTGPLVRTPPRLDRAVRPPVFMDPSHLDLIGPSVRPCLTSTGPLSVPHLGLIGPSHPAAPHLNAIEPFVHPCFWIRPVHPPVTQLDWIAPSIRLCPTST